MIQDSHGVFEATRRSRQREIALRFLPCVAAIVAASMVASCSLAPRSIKTASNDFSEKKDGVSANAQVVAAGDEVPASYYKVGKPYQVKGKTYRPKEDPTYSKIGVASWYGSAFHGRQTANGEIYHMGELTAAHPTLPLPSYVRVTNVTNDRSVVVRVNDRGPFKGGRIIDVSAAVAEMLDFKRAGTAKVKVEYVGRARMDGGDRQMLLASYSGPHDFGGNTLLASNATGAPRKSILTSFAPLPRTKQGQAGRSADMAPAPAYTPAAFSPSENLGSSILPAGFVRSYAPSDRFSRAHSAAAGLAYGGRTIKIVQVASKSDIVKADYIVDASSR